MNRSDSSMLTVYGLRTSGNCYKLQFLLDLLGRPYRWIDVDSANGATRTPEFLALNPNGRVPLLVLDDGRRLSESNAILCYLAEGTSFLPLDTWERARTLQWMFFEQYSHEPALAVMRYLIHFAEGPDHHKERLEELKPRAIDALRAMEHQLETWKFIAAEAITIADISLYPYTAWAEESGVSLEAYPAIRRWFGQVEAEPGFLPLMRDGAAQVLSYANYFEEELGREVSL